MSHFEVAGADRGSHPQELPMGPDGRRGSRMGAAAEAEEPPRSGRKASSRAWRRHRLVWVLLQVHEDALPPSRTSSMCEGERGRECSWRRV